MIRRLLPLLAAGLVAPVLLVPSLDATAGTATPPQARQINDARFDTGAELRSGNRNGVRVRKQRLLLASPGATRVYDGRRYDVGRWTSPWTEPGFGLTELIASWSARTPGDSWVEIGVRGRDAEGRRSSWDVLARWAADDRFVRRTSAGGQDDDLARVAVDTWVAATDAGLTAYQLRVKLMRRTGDKAKPSVDSIGAMASRLPSVDSVPVSKPGPGRGIVLDLPRFSQMVHEGHYPQWGGGGEAWCSPTSVSMVLAYYQALPGPKAYAWVPEGDVDRWVDYAARMTYDAAYGGTGNWAFNAAYAASRGRDAKVTRLRSLREAENYIADGVPLVVSLRFGPGELTNSPITSSNGHLLVIVGFTESGDVVVNDPAASSRSGVRRTYDRAEFENVWIPTSGGLTYVIR